MGKRCSPSRFRLISIWTRIEVGLQEVRNDSPPIILSGSRASVCQRIAGTGRASSSRGYVLTRREIYSDQFPAGEDNRGSDGDDRCNQARDDKSGLAYVFTVEGGISTRARRTYVYKLCPYIK